MNWLDVARVLLFASCGTNLIHGTLWHESHRPASQPASHQPASQPAMFVEQYLQRWRNCFGLPHLKMHMVHRHHVHTVHKTHMDKCSQALAPCAGAQAALLLDKFKLIWAQVAVVRTSLGESGLLIESAWDQLGFNSGIIVFTPRARVSIILGLY